MVGQGYVFDHPLPVSCPELLRTFVVPKYFARDRLLTGARVDDGQVPSARAVDAMWERAAPRAPARLHGARRLQRTTAAALWRELV